MRAARDDANPVIMLHTVFLFTEDDANPVIMLRTVYLYTLDVEGLGVGGNAVLV